MILNIYKTAYTTVFEHFFSSYAHNATPYCRQKQIELGLISQGFEECEQTLVTISNNLHMNFNKIGRLPNLEEYS